MAQFKLPLSGDVNQWITPITSWFSGNQISVNLGESNSTETEAEILTSGRHLRITTRQITDAMIVLLKHLPQGANLTHEEKEAIHAFKKMANQIADVKETHKREVMRPDGV
jgi:hypothetical protein